MVGIMHCVQCSTLQEYSGILFVDKPTGVTSHDVVAWARRITGVKRIGHAGTLDPLATGLLIVLVGREFTKRQAEFLKQEKEYVCTAVLGVETDSYDSDGQVIHRASPDQVREVTQLRIEAVLAKYRGEILQTVPAFSAVKRGGRKLYDLARAGKLAEAELPTRRVQIHELELLSFSVNEKQDRKIPVNFSVRVRCSSGTYIRSLISDIGKDLGVGATVTQLRRTAVGGFRLENALLCPVIQARKY